MTRASRDDTHKSICATLVRNPNEPADDVQEYAETRIFRKRKTSHSEDLFAGRRLASDSFVKQLELAGYDAYPLVKRAKTSDGNKGEQGWEIPGSSRHRSVMPLPTTREQARSAIMSSPEFDFIPGVPDHSTDRSGMSHTKKHSHHHTGSRRLSSPTSNRVFKRSNYRCREELPGTHDRFSQTTNDLHLERAALRGEQAALKRQEYILELEDNALQRREIEMRMEMEDFSEESESGDHAEPEST
jgi:hypothetical protein